MLRQACIKPFVWAVFSLVLLHLCPQAGAEQVLKRLNRPIEVKLLSTLDANELQAGDSFEGVLLEKQVYKNQHIPEGTLFRGHVQKAQHSRRFARAGYFDLQVDEAVLPTGETFAFDVQKFEARTKRYHHRKGVTVKRLITSTIPMTAASVGTSVPLRVAADMSAGLIYPIALGARTATAMTIEVFKQERDFPHMVGYSVARGTGALATYNFFRVSQRPVIAEGKTIKLYMNPDWVKGLMQANEDIQLLNSTPRSDSP